MPTRCAAPTSSRRVEVDFLDAVNGATRELILPDGRRLKVTIPAGTDRRPDAAAEGAGRRQPRRRPRRRSAPGDSTFARIPSSRRKDNDIWADLPITLGEALLGGKIEVPTIDGTVSMTVPKGSNTGTRLRVRGKGVPAAGGGRGDHYVTLQVSCRILRTTDLIRLVEQWSATHPYRVR